MNNVTAGLTCKNCGAPVTTEICPFCHCATGINTTQADMEYPVLNCKAAHLGFWNVGFPLIFAVSFGMAALLGIVISASISNSFDEVSGYANSFRGTSILMSIATGLPFLVISIVAFAFVIKQVVRYMSVKKNGQPITATVYGYMNDNYYINGTPAQVVKLLINTENGNRFILYKLGKIYQPYGVNTQIELIMYNNIFMINDKV